MLIPQLAITSKAVNDTLSQIALDVPRFSETLTVHQTTYPHVAPESLRPITSDHTGRRKRVPGGGGLSGNGNNLSGARDMYGQPLAPSPHKKRKLVEDDASSVRNSVVAKPKAKDKSGVTAGTSAAGGSRAKPKAA